MILRQLNEIVKTYAAIVDDESRNNSNSGCALSVIAKAFLRYSGSVICAIYKNAHTSGT